MRENKNTSEKTLSLGAGAGLRECQAHAISLRIETSCWPIDFGHAMRSLFLSELYRYCQYSYNYDFTQSLPGPYTLSLQNATPKSPHDIA